MQVSQVSQHILERHALVEVSGLLRKTCTTTLRCSSDQLVWCLTGLALSLSPSLCVGVSLSPSRSHTVCVCVCVWEREREQERNSLGCTLHICFLPANPDNLQSGFIRCGIHRQHTHTHAHTQTHYHTHTHNSGSRNCQVTKVVFYYTSDIYNITLLA